MEREHMPVNIQENTEIQQQKVYHIESGDANVRYLLIVRFIEQKDVL